MIAAAGRFPGAPDVETFWRNLSDGVESMRFCAEDEMRARDRYDHVIVDSPPSLALSDARTISRLVEGVVLVVSDKTERGSLLRVKQTLDDAGAPFLGFVMNRVNLDNLDYGHYRNYGYYYSYSDDPERKKRRSRKDAAEGRAA